LIQPDPELSPVIPPGAFISLTNFERDYYYSEIRAMAILTTAILTMMDRRYCLLTSGVRSVAVPTSCRAYFTADSAPYLS
jgi:hypothetical protein